MGNGSLFDVKRQLVFYGSYHNNKYNVAIHMVFVPIILWTALIMIASYPVPAFFPKETIPVYDSFLYLKWTWAVPFAAMYALYYLCLEPVAAVLYYPILSLMILSSGPIADQSWGVKAAAWLFALAWVAQFAGHGLAEKRAPALLDNIVGALVLAPFFVHLEILFAFGYRRQLHKEIVNGVGVEIANFRKGQGDALRAKTN